MRILSVTVPGLPKMDFFLFEIFACGDASYNRILLAVDGLFFSLFGPLELPKRMIALFGADIFATWRIYVYGVVDYCCTHYCQELFPN